MIFFPDKLKLTLFVEIGAATKATHIVTSVMTGKPITIQPLSTVSTTTGVLNRTTSVNNTINNSSDTTDGIN